MERLRDENAQMTGRWQQLRDALTSERARLSDEIKVTGQRAHEAERHVAALTAKLEAAAERVAATEAREREAQGRRDQKAR